jgi:acetyl-CoA carboxylase carboxyltransferase component
MRYRVDYVMPVGRGHWEAADAGEALRMYYTLLQAGAHVISFADLGGVAITLGQVRHSAGQGDSPQQGVH